MSAVEQKPRRSGAALELRKVPPFPPIATRLLSVLSKEFVSMPELAEIIGSDPTFSTRLLQCVNSALFGLSYPMTDVLHALSILGLDRTRQLTITLATSIYSHGALRTEELRRCWEHSVATAILANEIAQGYGAFTDAAYAAGILHDIGRLGLLTVYPQEYEQIIRDASGHCLDLLDFEREQFGIDHAEAGRMMAERWGLPSDFQLVAGRHHDPCEGGETDLLRIVHVACRMADCLGYGMISSLTENDLDAAIAELPASARSRVNVRCETLRALVDSRIRLFDHQEPGPESSPESTSDGSPVDDAFTIGVDFERDLSPRRSPVAWWIAGAILAALVVLLLSR